MNVLLTGARGFLGTRVHPLLAAAGHRVIRLVRGPSRQPGDLSCDGVDPRPEVASLGHVEVVVNLATAYGRDGDHASVARSNLIMPLLLLEQARAIGCRRWIEAGSFFTDNPCPGPLPAYAMGKRQFQEWLGLSAQGSGLSATIAHLHHLYGPGDREDKFIPSIIRRCRAGEDIALTSGRQQRDFVHVDDAAAAIAGLALADLPEGFRRIPVGSGSAIAVREAVEAIARITGGTASLRFGALPDPTDESPGGAADLHPLLSILPYRPRHFLAGIADVLASTTADTPKVG